MCYSLLMVKYFVKYLTIVAPYTKNYIGFLEYFYLYNLTSSSTLFSPGSKNERLNQTLVHA
jgi:hypothetical protein